MQLSQDPLVPARFDSFTPAIKEKLLHLREIILETAEKTEGLEQLEETLKWNEPSYLTKHGSTIRLNQVKKAKDTYAIFFKCTSKLVETFREIHGDTFTYEKNRGIHFKLDDPIPKTELKQCIRMALNYHKVKELPLLGYVDGDTQ